MGAPQLNTYAYYDGNWKVDPTFQGPVTISGKPGVTWVSLNWTPPPSGLATNLAGYVVCRSLPNAKSAPQFIQDGSSTIVYVGTGTHFGDLPLSENTTELLNADSGLLPGTTYWYSVFAVTPPPAQPDNAFPIFTPGSISPALSISITTLSSSAYLNLINDGIFANVTNTNSSWIFQPELGASSAVNVKPSTTAGPFLISGGTDAGKCCNGVNCYIPTTPNQCNQTNIDPNDPVININSDSLFSEYMTVQMPITSCLGVCAVGDTGCPRGRCIYSASEGGGCRPDNLINPAEPTLGRWCDSTNFPNTNPPTPPPACNCPASAPPNSTQVIYQTYKPPGGLVPGKLYSFSIWYRTNNPISANLAINGNNQTYTPKITVYGNDGPSEPSYKTTSILGSFQSEQYLENEGSKGNDDSAGKAVACSTSDDSTSCQRAAAYSNAANYQFYSNFTGIWQQAAFTFTIGSTEPSAIVNAYNTTGDPVQAYYAGSTKPETTFDAFTVSIEIPPNVSGNPNGYMDFANAELYEGPLPYTDPYWYINLNKTSSKNLVFNSNFWGVQTETQGTVSPGWNYPPALNMAPESQSCGAPCTGNAIVCLDSSKNLVTTASCASTCKGTCDVNTVCQGGTGSCVGSCTPNVGTCNIDNSYTCTGGFGTCTGDCTLSKVCELPSGGTGIGDCSGTCTGTCTYAEPMCQINANESCSGICNPPSTNPPTVPPPRAGACSCHTDKEVCTFPDNSDGTSGGNCTLAYSIVCPSNPCSDVGDYCKPSAPVPTCVNGTGSCSGSCEGTCSSTCQNGSGTCGQDPKSNPGCSGSAQGTGICSAGTGNCTGAAVCLDTSNPLYSMYAKTQSPICAPNQPGISSYLAIQGCSCQTITVEQANLKGSMGWFMGSFGLAPNTTYTLSFDIMVIENTNPTIPPSNNTFDIYINDITGTTFQYTSLTFTSDVSTATGFVPSTHYTAGNAPITFITPATPINLDLQFQIYKKSLSVGIKNVQINAIGGEIYGIQNPHPALLTKPSTTSSANGSDAILWRLPESATNKDCKQCVLFGETANSGDLKELLGWPQGLTLFNGFSHTGNFVDNFNIVTDTDTYLSSTLNFGSNTNVMQLNVENYDDTGVTSNSSAFIMSNGYYGSGQWDVWVKLNEVLDANKNVLMNTDTSQPTNGPANPIGCTFAFWIFHGLDYSVAGGPKILNEPSPFRNTEIDIEMNGSCPDYSFNFTNSTGRLNGWGGQAGGDGSNFTMHTYMPEDPTTKTQINLNDGKYHKLSILYHSGIDPTPDKISPNAIPNPTNATAYPNYPTARIPGFVKWFVDDIEWGCGWTGNTYGQDNVPMTATRMVVGPWNPGWAGCSVCCANSTLPNNGVCPCPSGAAPMTTADGETIPATQCVTWDTATFNIAQIQFTPICEDCLLPTSKLPYCPAVSLPARPNPTELPPNAASNAPNIITAASGSCGANNVGPPNRDRTLPESKSFMVVPPMGCNFAGECCNGSQCNADTSGTCKSDGSTQGAYCEFS